WTDQVLQEFNSIFQQAAMLGITVVAAAGDRGASDGVTDGQTHVDFPASSPLVLACGGTSIKVSDKSISAEVVWNNGESGATGGGVSDVFPRPVWQSGVNIPPGKNGRSGRGLPDVAAHADPRSGYYAHVHGQSMIFGGTSASAPLWAGLIALINQGVGHNVGYINPVLYRTIGPAGVLRSITEGNNGIGNVKGYAASPGWNASTGWGSPNGSKLLQAFRALPASARE